MLKKFGIILSKSICKASIKDVIVQIFPINFISTNFQKPKSMMATFQPSFEQKNSIAFGANTSEGNVLKKLRRMKCPYFGVEMILGSDIGNIERKLDKCTNIAEAVAVLSKFKKYMQKTEKKIFKRFESCAKTHPDFQMQDCLKMWYSGAITKLKLEEFKVLDDVDKISLGMSSNNALAVHAKTTRCRQVIIENNKEDTFKRKILLDSLDEITPNKSERKTFGLLKDRAVYLPTSGTSENAFIVKYADRSQQEIAKRLLRPSVATIEHVKPNSHSGANDIGNFILASGGANSMRSNMPLYKFIKMFPNIPKHCQNYINQIINYIDRGWLKGKETYPYKIRRTLARESKGSILLDLSNYKYDEKQAVAAERRAFFKKNKR